MVTAVLLRRLQPRMRRREGLVSLWAASLGWGVGCTGVQLRGGDHTDLGWGAPDISQQGARVL